MGRKMAEVKANFAWTRTFAFSLPEEGTNAVSNKQMPTSLRLKRACSSSFTIFAFSPLTSGGFEKCGVCEWWLPAC